MAHCYLLEGTNYGIVILLHGTLAQYVIMLEDTNYGTVCDCAVEYFVTMCDHAGVLLLFSNVRFNASSKHTCLHVLPPD